MQDLFPEYEDYIEERRARAPKLKGIAKKKRDAKAQLMKEVMKDPQVEKAKQAFLRVFKAKARKTAKEMKIPLKRLDLDAIKLKDN